jgi:hypothetical protein
MLDGEPLAALTAERLDELLAGAGR